MLKSRADIPRDTALVSASNPGLAAPYIALRTHKWHLPSIRWTVFKTKVDSSLAKDTVVIGWSELSAPIPIIYEPIDPPKLTHIVVTAPGPSFESLKARQAELVTRLPGLIRQGDYIDTLNCRVRACEPADQGLIDEKTVISVALENSGPVALPDGSFSLNSIDQDQDLEVEISQFLSTNTEILELGVTILDRPIPEQSLVPRPDSREDLENACFLRVDQIAQLGIFSGDLVKLKPILSSEKESTDRSRIVRILAYPEPNTISANVYMSPLLAYNLGGPSEVQVIRSSPKEPFNLQVAKDVTISRISSPISTDRAYQQAFLSALRSYFENSYRVVKNNDVIAVPIDTTLAQTLYNPSSNGEDELALTGKSDALVWFKICGLEENEQNIISASHTRMVQSGSVQEKAVPSNFKWARYYDLPPLPLYFEHGTDHFKYAWKVRKLLESSMTPRGAALNTTVLMTSSKNGAGKATVLKSVAAELGVHVMEIDGYSIIGESDTKTVGTLKARLERASGIAPCLVILKHIDAIAKKSEQDGRDPTIIANITEVLDEYIGYPSLFIAATVSDADKLSDSVRNRFKFEIDVTVPTEKERQYIFQYLTAYILPPSQLISDAHISNILEGYSLQGNITVSSLALQSAGLTPPDLVSIIGVAKQRAYSRIDNNPDLILAQRGIIKISGSDIEKAISDARSKYSDSIGAPKIPNVGWKDVGGLENVKGEIMDTIDMPLRYPHLFKSGVKKRSGILFYGPPGTGKTLLAKAIATSFSLNFFSVKGPELLNMYIGESEANVRRVFQKARDARPCVVFFDELDSVAPKRGNQGDSGGVMDRIVSQLLAELDGMSQGSEDVFVIGATNRPDLLDEALLRPGRFDKMLYLGVSDTHEKQRTILEALTRKFDLSKDVDLHDIAAKCPFTYTGADFYAMSSDAMLNAMTRTAGEVDYKISIYNKQREHNGEHTVTIRSWFEHVATEEDTKVEVSAADFTKALRELVPSVSADELAHYLRVRNSFEGKSQPQKSLPATNAPQTNGTAPINGHAAGEGHGPGVPNINGPIEASKKPKANPEKH